MSENKNFQELSLDKLEKVSGGAEGSDSIPEGSELHAIGCEVSAVKCPLCGSPNLIMTRVGMGPNTSGIEVYRCRACNYDWPTGRD